MSSARLVAKVEALLAKFPELANAELRGVTLDSWLEAAEAWRIAKAFEQAGGHRTEAARALGISRRTLYSRMEKLGIDPSRNNGQVPALRTLRAPRKQRVAQGRRAERSAEPLRIHG